VGRRREVRRRSRTRLGRLPWAEGTGRGPLVARTELRQ
jgi:hypothetical protein